MYLQILFLVAQAFLCIILTKALPHDDTYMHPQIKFEIPPSRSEDDYEKSEFWWTSAQDSLAQKLKEEKIVGKAKNVILFLGDGWGLPTVTLARILKGQKVDNVTFGEEGFLHVDGFPHTGLSKTFCTDSQVADSACSATAYLCGVKANMATIGVSTEVKRKNCSAQMDPKNHVSSILAWAQAAGKSTGIVTTTRITHASPTGNYAHICDRDWECDIDILKHGGNETGANPANCDDIAEQLILKEPGKNINVIMGGGRTKFFPQGKRDSENQEGERGDGKDLLEEWKKSKPLGINATYIESGKLLQSVDAARTDYFLGLFGGDHLAYYHEQAENDDPSLTDMTEKAIQILSKNPNGYFLFVEGGRIDHGHHNNWGMRALWEAVEFDKAVKKGDEMTNDEDTLIVATADHSHVFSFAGYAPRGHELWEFAGTGADGLKYATLNYANGPGWKPFSGPNCEQRHDISKDDIESLTYRQVPLVSKLEETHGGEDVAIFAKGPFAHLLTGVQLQSYIPHVMAYASCIGSGLKYCDE